MVETSMRPLKCRFCWRRYKYDACLQHHVKTVHSETIQRMMYQKYVLKFRLNMIQQLQSRLAATSRSVLRQEVDAMEANDVHSMSDNNDNYSDTMSQSSRTSSCGLDGVTITSTKNQYRPSVIKHISQI